MQVMYDSLRMCLLLFVVLILAVLIYIVQLIIFYYFTIPPPLSILTRGHALMDEKDVGEEEGESRMEGRREGGRDGGRGGEINMRVKHLLGIPSYWGLNPNMDTCLKRNWTLNLLFVQDYAPTNWTTVVRAQLIFISLYLLLVVCFSPEKLEISVIF